MANHLDLEEQEQLDQLKHFWKQYGNFITWALVAVLGAFAAWNAYSYWQTNQSSKAAALYDEVEKSVRSGDVEKASRAFGDMKDKFASTAYTQQAGLLVARMAYDLAKVDVAKDSLSWVSTNGSDNGYASLARLRLAGILLDTKAYDEALKILEAPVAAEFLPLVADRKADILVARGKKAEAKAEYLKAYKALDERNDYRRLVKVKLNALGVAVDGAN